MEQTSGDLVGKRQRREQVVREISRTTVSSKSPRQIVSLSCVRTAGVGSTGMNAAGFTAGVSKSVASVASPVALVASVASPSVASAFVASVASVASQFTVPGALRLCPSVLSSSVSSGFVASTSPPRDGCESRSGPNRQLRQVASSSSQSSALVLRRVRGQSVASPKSSVRIRVSSVASRVRRSWCCVRRS